MSLVAEFTEMKRIYGFCPCCGALFRLSDATLFTNRAPPRAPFDEVNESQSRLDRAIELFEEREESIRHKAREKGQDLARQRLKKIATMLVARKLDPQDVKVIFDPVDYVVFRGLNQDRGVNSIELLDRAPDTSRRERVHESIQRAIRNGNVEWQTLRIDGDGSLSRE